MAKKRGNNEGSVYKRSDGLWAAQISLPDGKRKYKYAKSQKEANAWLLSQRQAVRDQAWTSDDTVTLGVFLDQYVQQILTPTVRTSTLVSYQLYINSHIKPALGEVRLSRLSPPQVQRFYTEKLKSGLTPRTVQYIHAILHKALDQAMRWDLVPRNVSDMVDPPSVKRQTPVVWSLDQVKQFVEAAKDHRYYALFVLALSCGLRQGEILGLQIEDVDLTTGFLHVRQALEIVRGAGWRLSLPKTDRSRRRIRIPGPTLEVLRAHLAAQSQLKGFLFRSAADTPILPRNLVRDFKELIGKAGLPDIRFHDLRHLCATLHLMAGTNPAVVAQILGHSTITLTLQTYSHVLAPVEEEAADRMGKLLTA